MVDKHATVHEARSLLGRLDYQRGNVEGALHVFYGIDLQAASERLQSSIADKNGQKNRQEGGSQHATSLWRRISYVQVDTRLQETVSQAVELLPELWKQAGYCPEAISAYRRALLSQWSLDNDCCARIQKAFAVFLLHSGVEASPPRLASQVEGSYVPKDNLEEAVLLLLILVRKLSLGKTKWGPSVMKHLTFALSMCSQTGVLVKETTALIVGIL
ncbi:Protein NPG1 [Linum perenne]